MPSWVRSELATVTTALAGQLRSAIHVAAGRLSGQDSVRPRHRGLARRWRSPIRTPIERCLRTSPGNRPPFATPCGWRQHWGWRRRLPARRRFRTVLASAHGARRPPSGLHLDGRPGCEPHPRNHRRRCTGDAAGSAAAAGQRRPHCALHGLRLVSYLVVRANYTLFSIAVTSYVVFLLALRSCRSCRRSRTDSPRPCSGSPRRHCYLLWPTWESRLVGPQLADLLEAQPITPGRPRRLRRPGRGRPPPPRRAAVDRQRARSNAEASLDRMTTEPPRATARSRSASGRRRVCWRRRVVSPWQCSRCTRSPQAGSRRCRR